MEKGCYRGSREKGQRSSQRGSTGKIMTDWFEKGSNIELPDSQTRPEIGSYEFEDQWLIHKSKLFNARLDHSGVLKGMMEINA